MGASLNFYHSKKVLPDSNIYENKFAADDANQLELNKVRLNYTSIVADLRKAEADRDEVRDNLLRLNGNEPVNFTHSRYDKLQMPALADLLSRAEAQAPQLEMVKRN